MLGWRGSTHFANESDATTTMATAMSEALSGAQNGGELEAMQAELDSLRAEVRMLHSRDGLLNLYMQRMDEELRLASRLQRDFLPRTCPEVGRVRFHTLFRPAGYVSGDLYDVIRIDEEHLGFYIADAVGHGMPAALLTMFMKRALVTKEILTEGYRLLKPSETMQRLNEALLEQNLSQATFATALYGTINAYSLEMTFARGGHPPPLLLKADGELEALEADGGLLGIFPNETFLDSTPAVLKEGDRLIVFTDGIEVAFSYDQTLDTTRWKEELSSRRHMSSEKLLLDLSEHIDSESGSLTPKDDLTMIIVEAV